MYEIGLKNHTTLRGTGVGFRIDRFCVINLVNMSNCTVKFGYEALEDRAILSFIKDKIARSFSACNFFRL